MKVPVESEYTGALFAAIPDYDIAMASAFKKALPAGWNLAVHSLVTLHVLQIEKKLDVYLPFVYMSPIFGCGLSQLSSMIISLEKAMNSMPSANVPGLKANQGELLNAMKCSAFSRIVNIKKEGRFVFKKRGAVIAADNLGITDGADGNFSGLIGGNHAENKIFMDRVTATTILIGGSPADVPINIGTKVVLDGCYAWIIAKHIHLILMAPTSAREGTESATVQEKLKSFIPSHGVTVDGLPISDGLFFCPQLYMIINEIKMSTRIS